MKNRFILRALLVGALVVQTLLPAFAAAPALKILSASPKGKLYAGGVILFRYRLTNLLPRWGKNGVLFGCLPAYYFSRN